MWGIRGEGGGGEGGGDGGGGLGGGEGGGGLSGGEGGLAGGEGDSGGGEGGSGGGSTQQASLHFLESAFFPFAVHSFIHFFSFLLSALHDFFAFLWSFFLHFVSSATQSFSDVAAAVLFVSSADSVFKLSTGVVVTAPTQFSMQKAASSLGRKVPFILASVAFFICVVGER